jgi:Na+/H+ antiporter NhaD/arsenite permease-like protein
MQHVRLAQLGVYYSTSMVILLAVLGLAFAECPTMRELAAIALAIAAVLLLARV